MFGFIKKLFSRIDKENTSNKKSKEFLFDGGNLVLNSKSKLLVEKVKFDIEKILNDTNFDIDNMVEYVINTSTSVFIIPNIIHILKLLGEEEGFITEQKGLRALILSLIINKNFKFYFNSCFILSGKSINQYYFLLHFYKWYSFHCGLEGFDYPSQRLFKNYLKTGKIKKLKMKEIINLQEAMNRDKEATDFVLEYKTKIDGSKNAINKLKSDGSARI